MRVVMVSKACVVGQYQTKLEEIAKHKDIELTVVVPPFWRDERGVLSLERAHINGYTLRVEPMRFNGEFHLHHYPTLPRVLKEIRPHLVHIDEEPYNLATFLAMHAAQRVNAKTLFFTWQNLHRRYPLPFEWMESYVFQNADYAIAGNADAVDVLRAKGYRKGVSVIAQFGVDPASYQVPPQRDVDIFRIGYAGRLVPEKGIDILLHAAATLSGNWELRVVGSGPDLARLQSLAHELRIDPRVHFESPRPSVEMPAWYAAVNVVVQPSLTRPNWKEQFNRVLIEAMASGVPVIASTCGEMSNVVSTAGLIFGEGDVAGLAMHLVHLQNNLARRIELGALGRARVQATFTQAKIAAETCAVYRQIAA